MIFFKRRFGDLIERQLDLFESDNGQLFERIADAETDYRTAASTEAEERFGELQELLEEGTDGLIELRDAYALTLDEPTSEEYVAAFDWAVLRRFPLFALELQDEEEDEEND